MKVVISFGDETPERAFEMPAAPDVGDVIVLQSGLAVRVTGRAFRPDAGGELEFVATVQCVEGL